jgi:hypothetical protein
MLQYTQFFALLCTALFSGASIYINVVEHPARMLVNVPFARDQWLVGYQWGKIMQASLAIVGCLSGIAAWWLTGVLLWLIAGLFIGFVVPFTFIVIWPTHRKLQVAEGGSPELRPLLERWARLHAVRSGSSLLAAILMLWQLTVGAP